ncbi:SPOR domain-containing protein [Colwelliaceae bacterium 6471]
MSAIAHSIDSSTDDSDVTQISTNARVDYILRFSKHAVLVVDQEAKHYSLVGSQYLAALPESQNAAFVSISSKLNNIQIRCRIVEQLFGNSLFDPEQSLAVTLINLAQQDNDKISIVVEHAHLLSLQVMHELCQLAEIAKKANYEISVLMLGTYGAGSIPADNTVLFDKKLSILSAQSGQLIAINSKIFKAPSSFFNFTFGKKILLSIFVFSCLLASTLVALYQRDVLSFSALTDKTSQTTQASNALVTSTDILDNSESVESMALDQGEANISVNNIASTDEVYASLLGELLPNEQDLQMGLKITTGPASPIDIVNAIAMYGDNADGITKQAETLQAKPNNQSSNQILTEESEMDGSMVNTEKSNHGIAYYQQNPSGYVVQYAGIRQQEVVAEFARDHSKLEYHQYQRLLGDSPLFVLTSEIFATRAQAEMKITSLSSKMLKREPWVKPVSMIISEINALQGSQ